MRVLQIIVFLLGFLIAVSNIVPPPGMVQSFLTNVGK